MDGLALICYAIGCLHGPLELSTEVETDPIFVPGLHGIGLRLSGCSDQQGPTRLAALRWWTSRGPLASDECNENCKLLCLSSRRWGRRLNLSSARWTWSQTGGGETGTRQTRSGSPHHL